jgi:hypothetical protein
VFAGWVGLRLLDLIAVVPEMETSSRKTRICLISSLLSARVTTLDCLGQFITSGQSQNREMMPVKAIIPVMNGAAAALILGVALIRKIWDLVSRDADSTYSALGLWWKLLGYFPAQK